MNPPVLRDKTGREIMVGDVLKVFHFEGARKKKHYMYKWVLRRESYPHGDFFIVSHLSAGKVESAYNLKVTASVLEDVEIVQGFNSCDSGISFLDRQRSKT